MKRVLMAVWAVFLVGAAAGLAPGQQTQADRDEIYADYEQGKDLFYKKDYDKARRKFESVLRERPDDRGANQYLGRIYLIQKNYSRAIRHLEDCLKQTTGSYRRAPLNFLAEAYEGAGNNRKALSTWEEYLKYVDTGSEYEAKAKERIRALGGTVPGE